MVFDRSLVLGVHERIGVRVLDHSGRVVVSVDGALAGVLDPGDWVIVFAGPHRTKLVRMKDTDFVGRVRERFRLADAVATLAEDPAPELFRPSEPLPPDLANPGPRD
jgi:NAD+ kinase